ncbi:TRAP transporter small permease subunit [Maricaulis maris]|jgi:TRAP-type mannitol/chloroaromatic compound transport system permease small subunit|uniref:TRAP transporter small permease protein n=2 Tax=Maricaulis TaxID=74317 RepID=Q0APD4_MARMM|nr:TRAP transporter small permease subunit [Maricaulis maris]ABI65853.1 Tripartite ATP-independent periplasmic transporter, DctQ component [Maricaulis maris MCS10]
MRKGDGLLLSVVLLSLGLLIADMMSGGGVSAALNARLPGMAQSAGRRLGQLGVWLSPFLLVPLISGLLGRVLDLPERLWAAQRAAVNRIDAITEIIAGAARWFALGLVVATAIIVIQRYVFGYASTKLAESVIYMHALLFLLSSGSTLLHGGHVRVDVFFAKMSPQGRAWVDLLGTYLALIPMSFLILWSSTGYLNSTWRILESSRESDGLAFVFLLKTAIPLFAILMILQGFSMAARAAMTLGGQKPPALPAAAEGEV